MGAGDGARDREAETGAARLGRAEGLEEVRGEGRIDAGPVIDDLEDDLGRLVAQGHDDVLAGLGGVAQEVHDDLADAQRVDLDLGDPAHDLEPAAVAGDLEGGAGVGDELGQIGRKERESRRTREVEEAGHDLAATIGLALDSREVQPRAGLEVRGVGECFVEDLGVARDGGERVVDLVRDAGRELAERGEALGGQQAFGVVGEVLSHGVHLGREAAELVVRADRDAVAELAGGEAARALFEVGERAAERGQEATTDDECQAEREREHEQEQRELAVATGLGVVLGVVDAGADGRGELVDLAAELVGEPERLVMRGDERLARAAETRDDLPLEVLVEAFELGRDTSEELAILGATEHAIERDREVAGVDERGRVVREVAAVVEHDRVRLVGVDVARRKREPEGRRHLALGGGDLVELAMQGLVRGQADRGGEHDQRPEHGEREDEAPAERGGCRCRCHGGSVTRRVTVFNTGGSHPGAMNRAATAPPPGWTGPTRRLAWVVLRAARPRGIMAVSWRGGHCVVLMMETSKTLALSLLTVIALAGSALAHGGEDHGVAAPVVVGDEVDSAEARTERLELLVRWPHPHEVTWPLEAFLSEAETNTPVEAKLELRFDGPSSFKVAMEPGGRGRFRGEAAAPQAGTYAVTAVVTVEGGGEVLVIDALVVEPEHAVETEDHHAPLPIVFWAVLGGVLLVGVVFFGLMSRRASALVLVVGIGFYGAAEPSDARGHGGDDHEHAAAPNSGAVAGAGQAVHLPKEAQFLLEVRTGRVVQGTVTPRITVTGMVTVSPGHDREVVAPLTGMLTPVAPLVLGRRVEAGEVLYRLMVLPDAGDLASLRAEAAREEARQAGLSARVKQASQALVRAKALVKGESLAQREVEEAEAELAEAKAELLASRRAVEALGEGGQATLEITSPIAGELAAIHAVSGQVVGGAPLVRVVDTRELQVAARLLETDLGRIAPNSPAELRVGTSVLSAEHLYTSPLVDPVTRAVSIQYRPKVSADSALLKVNQVVTLALPTGPRLDALLVPDAAILDIDGRPAVWVKRSAEVFEPAFVRVLAREGGRTGVAVLGDELHTGDLVVTSGAAFLRGAKSAGSR